MNATVVAAYVAAGASLVTLAGMFISQRMSSRATSRDNEKTLSQQREQSEKTLEQQREQLDRTLKAQSEQVDTQLKAQSKQLEDTLAEQRTRTLNERFATAAALPVSAGDASGPAWLIQPRAFRGFGRAWSAPCPFVAAGFCDRAVVSGTGASPGRRSRRPQGVLDAAARERIMLGGKGQGGPWGGGERLAVQVGAFLSGGVTKPVMPGPGGSGAASLTWVRGARALPRRQDD
jgi:hypothetical protein